MEYTDRPVSGSATALTSDTARMAQPVSVCPGSLSKTIEQPLPAAPAAAPAVPKPALPDIAARKPVAAAHMQSWLGVWRDPWFGEVRVCPLDAGVEWRSAKSPRMHGMVGDLGGRYLVHWEDIAVDIDAWLDFAGSGDARTLRMAKLDPDGDFSSDYEDLAFTRVRDCD